MRSGNPDALVTSNHGPQRRSLSLIVRLEFAMWCPYTDKEIDESESNPEHILPLALGGCKAFTIPVARSANSTIGSEIDGALTNDPLIAFARREFDARGHSGTQPKVISKRATFRDRPAQVSLARWHPRRSAGHLTARRFPSSSPEPVAVQSAKVDQCYTQRRSRCRGVPGFPLH